MAGDGGKQKSGKDRQRVSGVKGACCVGTEAKDRREITKDHPDSVPQDGRNGSRQKRESVKEIPLSMPQDGGGSAGRVSEHSAAFCRIINRPRVDNPCALLQHPV